jgi:hypothetical protein
MRGSPVGSIWSADQKSVYVDIAENAEVRFNIWKWDVSSSTPERFMDDCGVVFVHPVDARRGNLLC